MADYYEVLELQKTATFEDVEKAYKKLALKWHPDKNPENLEEANIKFKEISRAYQVLIDQSKRGIYDEYGQEGIDMLSGEGQYENIIPTFTFKNPEDVFKEFFAATSSENTFPNHTVGASPTDRVQIYPNSGNIRPPFFGQLGLPRFGAPRVNNLLHGQPRSSPWQHSIFFRNSDTGTAGHSIVSTRIINGTNITVLRIYENGAKIIILFENGVVTSRTVNGIPQPISYT